MGSMKTATMKSWQTIGVKLMWALLGNNVTDAVKSRKVMYIPVKRGGGDLKPCNAARRLLAGELSNLVFSLMLSVDFNPSAGLSSSDIASLHLNATSSCEVLGIDYSCAIDLTSFALLAFRDWQYRMLNDGRFALENSTGKKKK